MRELAGARHVQVANKLPPRVASSVADMLGLAIAPLVQCDALARSRLVVGDEQQVALRSTTSGTTTHRRVLMVVVALVMLVLGRRLCCACRGRQVDMACGGAS